MRTGRAAAAAAREFFDLRYFIIRDFFFTPSGRRRLYRILLLCIIFIAYIACTLLYCS